MVRSVNKDNFNNAGTKLKHQGSMQNDIDLARGTMHDLMTVKLHIYLLIEADKEHRRELYTHVGITTTMEHYQ